MTPAKGNFAVKLRHFRVDVSIFRKVGGKDLNCPQTAVGVPQIIECWREEAET
jgi:hypothetical protein